MTAPQRYIAKNLTPEQRALKLDNYERFIERVQQEAARKLEFIRLLKQERDRFIAACKDLEEEEREDS